MPGRPGEDQVRLAPAFTLNRVDKTQQAATPLSGVCRHDTTLTRSITRALSAALEVVRSTRVALFIDVEGVEAMKVQLHDGPEEECAHVAELATSPRQLAETVAVIVQRFYVLDEKKGDTSTTSISALPKVRHLGNVATRKLSLGNDTPNITTFENYEQRNRYVV